MRTHRIPMTLFMLAVGVNLGWQFRMRRSLIIDLTFGLGYGRDAEGDREGVSMVKIFN